MQIKPGDIFQWIDDKVICDDDAGHFVLVVGTLLPQGCELPLVILQDERGKTTDWTVRTLTRCANRVVEAPDADHQAG